MHRPFAARSSTNSGGCVYFKNCYLGKGTTGDLPPRKECAPLWHPSVLSRLKKVELVLLIGSYSTNEYLPIDGRNLTQREESFEDYLPKYWPLPQIDFGVQKTHGLSKVWYRFYKKK